MHQSTLRVRYLKLVCWWQVRLLAAGVAERPVRQLDSKESRRPRETLTPLSEALWLQIDTAFDNEQFRDLAHHFLSRPEFEKAAVVVCWHPPRGAGRCERRIVIVVRNHGE